MSGSVSASKLRTLTPKLGFYVPTAPKLWLDIADLSGVAHGSSLSTWGGATAYAAGTGALPAMDRTTESLPFVTFRGTGNTDGGYMDFGVQTFNTNTTGGFTFVGLVRFRQITGQERMFDFAYDGTYDDTMNMGRLSDSTTAHINIREGTTTIMKLDASYITPILFNTWQTFAGRMQKEGTDIWRQSVWVDGVKTDGTQTSFVLADRTPTKTYVGRSWAASPMDLGNFDVREMIWYDSALSDAHISAAQTYLQAKYNVTSSNQAPRTLRVSKLTFGTPAILDTLSATTKSSCQCAFSLRRLTRTLYTGPVVRLRRGSDNLERDFYGLDTDAASITEFLQGTTGYVKTLYDQSGKGRHATQTTAANQPQYITGGSSGWSTTPTIRFGGGNETLLSFNGNGILNTSYTVLTVNARVGGVGETYYVGGVSSSGTATNLRLGWSVGGARIRWDQRNSLQELYPLNPTYTVQQGEVHSFIMRVGTDRVIRRVVPSGTLQTTSLGINVQALTSWGSASIGRELNAGGISPSYYQGDFNELLTFSMGLSAAECAVYENNSLSKIINASTARVPRTLKISKLTSLHSKRLLDLVPQTAAACAYSVARKLRATYGGPCLRLRNASNIEKDIYFTSKWELDQLSVLAHCGVGDGFVSVLYDQSGNGRHATQTTTGNQPALVVAGVVQTQNGKPAIVFDGINDFLEFDGTVLVSTNYTVTVACARTSSKAGYNFVLAAQNSFHLGYRFNTQVTHAHFGNDYDMTVPGFIAPALECFAFRHSSTLGKNTYINGGFLGSSVNTLSLVAAPNARIGQFIILGGPTYYYQGNFTEACLFRSYLADNDRAALDGDTMTYYGIA